MGIEQLINKWFLEKTQSRKEIPLAPLVRACPDNYREGVARIEPQKLGWKGCFNFSFFTSIFFGKQNANPPWKGARGILL